MSSRGWVVAAGLLAATLLTAALSAAAIGQGPREVGYVGVFGLSILTNAVLFLPSGRGAVLIAGALVLNPLAVAILTGVGGAIGEMTGYALGASSRKLVASKSAPRWLHRVARHHMAASIVVIAIVPNPFVDAVGIVAGRLGYPLPRFLLWSIVGKVTQSIAYVYLVLWNFSLVSSWLGMGS